MAVKRQLARRRNRFRDHLVIHIVEGDWTALFGQLGNGLAESMRTLPERNSRPGGSGDEHQTADEDGNIPPDRRHSRGVFSMGERRRQRHRRRAFHDGDRGNKAIAGTNDCLYIDAVPIVVPDEGNNAVKKIPYSGGSYETPVKLGSFNNPFGVAVDSAGNVYVADNGNTTIMKIALATPPTLSFSSPTPAGTTDTTDGPQAVTVQNIGNAPLTFLSPTPSSWPASAWARRAPRACSWLT